MKSDKRIEWIDLLRAFAIITVLLCHATEGIYKLNLDYMSNVMLHSKIIAFTGFTIGRLGVPIFLMISGYLLLDRVYDKKKTLKFWKHNWVCLLVCTEFWFLVYDIFLKIYSKQQITLSVLVKDLLLIHKIDMGHTWYMPMILGIYILIPFVATALNSFDIQMLKFPLVFYGMISFGYPLINVINNVLQKESMSLQLSNGFSGGAYGFYLLVGYLLKKGILKNLKKQLLVLAGAAFFVLAVAFQIWAYSNNYAYNIWYDNPFLLCAAIMIFELVSRIKEVPAYEVVRWMSYYSFAVYLIHFMICIVAINCVSVTNIRPSIQVIIVWVLSAVLSYIYAWVIDHIPKIGKVILNSK